MATTNVEYPELGSPDPLADSSMEQYASQSSPRRSSASTNTQSRQRHRSSNEIEISASDMVVDQAVSPWRIKVTVQAEQEDTNAGRGQTITRTVKIPLRDASSPSKTLGTKTTSGRADSPARKTRSRRKSVTNLDAVVLGDDSEQDEWNARPKSPRKRRNSKSQGTKAASQRQTSEEFEIREDHVAQPPEDGLEARSRDHQTPEMREVDLNKIALRTRSNSKTSGVVDQQNGARNVSMNSVLSYPTPSPTASEFGRSDEAAQVNLADEVGLDTVMESEGFTMIDLESLPSVKQMKNTPEYPTIAEEPEQESVTFEGQTDAQEPDTNAPSIHLTVDESSGLSDLASSPPNGAKKKTYSIGHLHLPSSTNVHRHRHVTPMPQTSPSLPSPPRAPVSVTKDRSPANSNKAVKAAKVFRDAVTPEYESEKVKSSTGKEEDGLFGGFSSSTRRELRAELRFGEELGKRHETSAGARSTRTSDGVGSSAQQVWRGETTVQHTPPVQAGGHKNIPIDLMKPAVAQPNDALMSTDAESRWQARARKAREEVIKQTETAQNEVVVIDGQSDEDAAEDETMGDIWLAEARNNSSSPRDEVRNDNATNEKPRRKLIPSPWKRGETMDGSHVSGNQSFSGLGWNNDLEDNGGFGAAIVAHPDRAQRYDRRRSGEFADGGTVSKQPHRLSSRSNSPDVVDQNDFTWRDASDVVEEETKELEADHQVGATTHLYETNLEDLSEQDLSSSPHIQNSKARQTRISEHDSTYSSLSEESTVELYRQRTSLSPSKERPNTPRSALKGGRAGFGAALNYGADSDETNTRKVVWSRRMSCMNEDWEESSRSIRSTQESFEDDTPTSTLR